MLEDDFLAHAGVFGMKWGVRKSKEDIVAERKTENKEFLTPDQRKLAITTGVAVGIGAIAVTSILRVKGLNKLKLAKRLDEQLKVNKYLDDKLKVDIFIATKELKNATKYKDIISQGKNFLTEVDDVVLPKGSLFHRVAGQIENEISTPKFATYVDNDVLRYRETWKNLAMTKKHYKTTFETLSDAKIASLSNVDKIRINIMDKPDLKTGKTLRDDFIEEIMEYKEIWEKSSGVKITQSSLQKKSPEEILKLTTGFGSDDSWKKESTKKLLTELKKQGYAGFTDKSDIGKNVAHPVILIDDVIFKTTSSILTDYERKIAKILLDQL